MSPIFPFDEHTHIETIWYLAVEEGFDIMAALFKTTQDAPWTLTVRTRIYASNDPFDSDDEKKVFTHACLTGNDDERRQQTINMDGMLRTFIDASKATIVTNDKLDIKGGFKDLIAVFKTKPWAHIQEVPFPEASGMVH